jgi:hypothetical protein
MTVCQNNFAYSVKCVFPLSKMNSQKIQLLANVKLLTECLSNKKVKQKKTFFRKIKEKEVHLNPLFCSKYY